MNYLAGLNLPFRLAYSYSSRKSYVQAANYIYLLVKYLYSAIIYLRNSSINTISLDIPPAKRIQRGNQFNFIG